MTLCFLRSIPCPDSDSTSRSRLIAKYRGPCRSKASLNSTSVSREPVSCQVWSPVSSKGVTCQSCTLTVFIAVVLGKKVVNVKSLVAGCGGYNLSVASTMVGSSRPINWPATSIIVPSGTSIPSSSINPGNLAASVPGSSNHSKLPPSFR